MDLEVVLLIAAAVVGIVVGLLHLVGYVPPRYRRMLREVQADTAKALGEAVDRVLTRFEGEDGSEAIPGLETLQNAFVGLPEAITHAVSDGIVDASTKIMQAQVAEFTEAQVPPGVQAMGTDAASVKALTKSLKIAVGTDMIGPYAGILAEWAPGTYAWLQEHPDSVQWALSQPWIQGIIKKVASMVPGRVTINESGGLSGEEAKRAWER